MQEESDERARFLLMVHDSLVEDIKKYQTSEAKLNQTVLDEQRDTRFLLMVNDSLVEEVKKYQISEAPLHKIVLELEQTNQDLHRKWWAVQDKNYVLEHEIFDVGQENKRLADENKRLADENKRLAEQNIELHTQMWSTKSTAARMPNPYTCVLPDNRLKCP
jgi:predicted RNase H-like nuclease (RuvC/YqgF family)